MKKSMLLIMMLVISLVSALPSSAQRYGGPRHDYNTNHGLYSVYYGVRIGMANSTINGYDGRSRTSLKLAAVAGFELTEKMPLFIETGLEYVQKGGRIGKGDVRQIYNLNYLQVPAVIKYIYDAGEEVTIQPMVGLTFGMGVGGHTKYYQDRIAMTSFGNDLFKRFDTGIRLGCGFGYRQLYLDVNYNIGLVNIVHNAFEDAHNNSLELSVGCNF